MYIIEIYKLLKQKNFIFVYGKKSWNFLILEFIDISIIKNYLMVIIYVSRFSSKLWHGYSSREIILRYIHDCEFLIEERLDIAKNLALRLIQKIRQQI